MIIITAKAHSILKDTLQAKGYEVLYAPAITYSELYNEIENATGLIVTTRVHINKPLLLKAKNLKWIGRLGSGMETIDVSTAQQMNITCVSSPEGNSNAVGEHALGMLLNVLRNITASTKEISSGKWIREENRGTELRGKTVGIVGYGHTGQAFAKLLSAFEVTVLAYDKYKFGFGSGNVKEASVEHLCKYADVISFHVPLHSSTFHMADDSFFNSLVNKPAILNTSRGSVIDTSALIKAIEKGQVAGAALDVLENEDLENYTTAEHEQLSFLNQHPNILLTPHIAGYTHEAMFKMSKVLLEKLNL